MTVHAPPDRVLGSAAKELLGGSPAAALVEEQLLRDSPLRLVACEPRYARYKPRTSLLVQYELGFDDGTTAWAHAWLYADGRAERAWRSASYARLLARARRRHPEPFATHAALDRSLGALLEVSPLDSRLPELVRASWRRKLRRALAAERGDPPGRKLRDPELVRHKPGRKALLRFPTRAGAVFVKLHADDDGARRAALAEAVAAAGVTTARPLAHVAGLRAVAYEQAPGVRLKDLRRGPGFVESFGAAAETVAALHRVVPPPGVDRKRANGHAGDAVGALVPSLAARADALARRIRTAAIDRHDPVVLAHGDFYDDQVLVSETGAVLLDLDDARRAPALVDVGTFLAHLSARTTGGEALRPAFLDACERAGIDVRGSSLFEAAALLGLATGPFRRLEPDWPTGIERIVALAELRLDEYRREPTAVAVDGRLPQLELLCDPKRARAPLARALGRDVSVSSVAVVKHKHGRRCTLSYRLHDGGRLFAKTYASDRARRVHDTARDVRGAGIATPAPLGWDEAASLVLLGALDGESVVPNVLGGDERVGVDAADLLHTLHTSSITLPRRHDLADELAPLRDRVLRLADSAPALAVTAERCLRLATAASEHPWPWRHRPVHRDFYESQLLVCDDGLAVLDLDDAAMSEPAVDVANFTAHLTLLSLRPGIRAAPIRRVSRAFVRRYRSLDPDLPPRVLTLLHATTLLRLAEIHLRAGERLSAGLLERSARLLTSISR